MRRIVIFLFVWLNICLFSCSASSETLLSLKSSGVDSMSFTINREQVTVPLLLPDATSLPLRYANPYVVDQAKLTKMYGKHLGYIGRQMGYFYVDYGFSKTLPSGNMMVAYTESGVPEQNDLSVDAPEKLFYRILEETELPLDFRIDCILATTGAYRFHYVTEDISDKREQARRYAYNSDTVHYCQRIDYTQPVKGHEQGYYRLRATQMIDGIPIFGDYYTDDCTNAHEYNGYPYVVMDGGIAELRMRSDSIYDFYFSGLIEPLGVLADDVMLTSFDDLQQAIQARIDSGELRSIDSIELGYTLALRIRDGQPMKPQMWSTEQNNVTTADDPAYVLTPCWRISGYDLKNGAKRLEYGLTEPSAWERYINGTYDLRLNAVTLAVWNEPISFD